MLIFLIGYMACGKSTIGRKLHQRLRWNLYDTDKEIVNEQDMSVAELFDTRGEEYFRERESATLKRLIDNNDTAIISTGGGAPIWGNNMELMSGAGLTIYLSRSAENIASRLSAFGREKRPKLRGLNDEELIEVLREGITDRDARYRESELVIEADTCTDEMIVELIVRHIKRIEG